MAGLNSNYVFLTPEGGWRLTDSRVSLDSIVHAYWEGLTPESIVSEFPSLRLEQVHGAIAFYLGHRDQVDRYLGEQNVRWRALNTESESAHATLLQRIRAAHLAPDPAEGK